MASLSAYLGALDMTDEKVRENKVRRVAERRGFTVVKSRRRDPMAVDYGRFQLFEAHGKMLALEGSLSEVERYLDAGHKAPIAPQKRQVKR